MADYVISTQISLTDKFTEKIKKIGTETNKFKDKLNDLDKTLKNTNSSSGRNFFKWLGSGVSEATKTGIKSLDKYEKKIFNFQNKIKNLGGTVAKSIFKLGVVGTGAGIGALKIGSDFETYKSMMMTAVRGSKDLRKLGDIKTVAGDYYKWANNFANLTPFSNDEVIRGTTRLASFGYDPKKLMTVLGDMAAARGTSLMQGIEAFIDAGVGEMERFKEYGITKEKIAEYAKSQGIDRSKILSKSNEVVNPQLFMQTLLNLIQSETKGGMKDRKNTLAGRFSTTLGLLKFNVGKMIGIMEDGEIRQGSFIEKIKESFGKLNTYLQSDEGKAAIDKWVSAFDKSLPQIISIFEEVGKKISNVEFISKLQDSINNFDPKNINNGLEEIKKHLDEIFETSQRVIGAMLGFELGKLFGVKGALIGAGLGFFSPEIVAGIKAIENMMDKGEIKVNEKTIGPLRPEIPVQANPYVATKSFSQYSKGININMNNVTFNNGTDVDLFVKGLAENIENR